MPDDPMTPSAAPPAATSQQPSVPVEALARAFADPSRWRILWQIGQGTPLPVYELARRLGLSQSLASKHVGVLRKAGLIVTGLGGLYQLAPALRPPPGSQTADLGVCTLHFDRAV